MTTGTLMNFLQGGPFFRRILPLCAEESSKQARALAQPFLSLGIYTID